MQHQGPTIQTVHICGSESRFEVGQVGREARADKGCKCVFRRTQNNSSTDPAWSEAEGRQRQMRSDALRREVAGCFSPRGESREVEMHQGKKKPNRVVLLVGFSGGPSMVPVVLLCPVSAVIMGARCQCCPSATLPGLWSSFFSCFRKFRPRVNFQFFLWYCAELHHTVLSLPLDVVASHTFRLLWRFSVYSSARHSHYFSEQEDSSSLYFENV